MMWWESTPGGNWVLMDGQTQIVFLARMGDYDWQATIYPWELKVTYSDCTLEKAAEKVCGMTRRLYNVVFKSIPTGFGR